MSHNVGGSHSSKSISDSQTSKRSIGMGEIELPSTFDDDYIPRLTAEGDIPADQDTYDCVMFIFFCEKHNRIAIYNTERTRVVWLPFVAIPKFATWEEASEDGVTILLNKSLEEPVDVRYGNKNITTTQQQYDQKSNFPKYRMNLINLLRIQLASGLYEVRLIQVVRLLPTPR